MKSKLYTPYSRQPVHNSTHSCVATVFKATILSSTVAVLMTQTAMAEVASNEDDPSFVLDTITIVAEREKATKATETTTTSKKIQEEHINTQQDLVRYNPEVSVAEVGRYGSKGFAIRGVDGNRVAMSYDGVSLPDQQINQFFSPYGYMYEGRLAPDTEMLSTVRVKAGSDSFASGSGAMGGAVNYESKEPDDLIKGGKEIGGYAKLGYTNKNEEFMQAVGLAGEKGKFSAIVNYAHREGHELKNHRMEGFDKDKLEPDYDFDNAPFYDGDASILPDPLHYDSHATMGKLYYSPTDEHRFGVEGGYQYRMNNGNHYTKKILSDPRIGYDESELTNYGINYRYYPSDSNWIDTIDADLSQHKVVGVADTFLYNGGYSSGGVPMGTKLEEEKYRPMYDDTTQLSISAKSLPIDTEKLGTHNLSMSTNYSKKDYELIMRERYAWDNSPNEEIFQFVGPAVKRDIYNFAIADNINISDKLDAEIGLRYDYHNFKPYMTKYNRVGLESADDSYWAKQLYKAGAFKETENVTMDNLGWLIGANYKVTPNWQLGYKASTGFMVPSNMQMYSAFEMFRNRLIPNPNLKPEKSINHELSVQGDFKDFSVNATGFYTDYSDFINSYYKSTPETLCEDPSTGEPYRKPNGDPLCISMPLTIAGSENIDKAKTYGLRLGGVWDVSKLADTEGKLQLTATASYAKDSTSKGISMLATQPPNGIFGIDYFAPEDNYQIHSKLRYLGAKKSEDAKVYTRDFDENDNQIIAPYEHIDKSKSAFVLDVYGSKKFDNGLKLSAGVYNVFDKKYVPWDNLRTLAETHVNSMVDSDGVGIQRYTAPGRNFAVALTYEY